MVFTNGFSLAEEDAFRRFAQTSPMMIHGPNCMGLINITDQLPLYPSTITEKVRRGKVALIAQSGSAAISLMNSTSVGFSKVVTMGSEFQVTAPDYMRWLAGDDETSVIGIVLEQIKDPRGFARAVESIHAAGKAVVVLKVGTSEVGALAVQAHTGALISRNDAYDCFFARCGVPTVADYDEMVATLECFATRPATRAEAESAIVGISGGETALACDLAARLNVPIADWSEETAARVKAAQPGSTGRNPLDLGATVHHTVEQDAEAIDAIIEDPAVDALVFIQDAQASLTPTMLGNYLPRIQAYGSHGQKTTKPVVLVSPTSENTHPRITEELSSHGVPVLRGLRNGLVALRNLEHPVASLARREAPPSLRARRASPQWRRRADPARACRSRRPASRRALGAHPRGLRHSSRALGSRALDEGGRRDRPRRSVTLWSPRSPRPTSRIAPISAGSSSASKIPRCCATRSTAFRARSERRGPTRGSKASNCSRSSPIASKPWPASSPHPPFGALVLVGTGGTLVELEADRAVGLSPLSRAEANSMIRRTRLGALLGGYRNLVAKTDTRRAREFARRSSPRLALDLHEHLAECDLNPVLIREGYRRGHRGRRAARGGKAFGAHHDGRPSKNGGWC